MLFLLKLAGYLVVGAVCSFFKWRSILVRWKKENTNFKSIMGGDLHIPDPAQHKGPLIGWTIGWPLGLIGLILEWLWENIIVRPAHWIYDLITEKTLK